MRLPFHQYVTPFIYEMQIAVKLFMSTVTGKKKIESFVNIAQTLIDATSLFHGISNFERYL